MANCHAIFKLRAAPINEAGGTSIPAGGRFEHVVSGRLVRAGPLRPLDSVPRNLQDHSELCRPLVKRSKTASADYWRQLLKDGL